MSRKSIQIIRKGDIRVPAIREVENWYSYVKLGSVPGIKSD